MARRSAFDLEASVDQILSRSPAVGLAVGIVENGRLQDFHGHGFADIESGTPITEDTVLRIASITKTFTAIAVMQLREQGLVDLDAPANDYLRAYQLVPAQPWFRPATVRHLLTHTAGLPELYRFRGLFSPDFGESFIAGQPLPSLAKFYGGSLVVHAEPGTRFVYNNHGPSTLGQLVEDVSGEPLHQYFRENIFEPLGMLESNLLRSERVRSRLATGYEIRSRGVELVAERDMVTAGAASIYSTPRDMARYVAALLGGGAVEDGSILKPETLAEMFRPQYQPDPRIPGMGLGFFRKDLSGHLAVGHQGTHPGFHSQILVVPDDGIGVMAFTNGARQADFWLPAEVTRLVRELIGATDDFDAGAYPPRPEIWNDLCGWYRLSAQPTDVRLRGMLGVGAEVILRGGRLMLRFLTPIPELYRGFPLEPADRDDPYLYRIDLSDSGLEPMKVVFGTDPEGLTTDLYIDLMPLRLSKQPAASNPRRWVLGGLGVLVASSAAVGLDRRRR